MRMETTAALLVSSVVLLALSAGAQVNTEKLRQGEPGFHGFLDGSLEYRSGNAGRIRVSTGARLEYAAEAVHTSFVQGSVDYAHKGDDRDTYINKAFAHVRWTAMWHPRVGTEVFAQVQFNEFLKLNLRVLGGFGVRVVVVDEEAFDLIVGTGYMSEYETLGLTQPDSHPTESLSPRWTSYVTLRFQLGARVALVSTTYAQPQLSDFGDFRLLEEAGLEVKLFEHLSLVTAFSLAHDSRSPDAVKSTDIVVAPRLKLHW